MTTIKIKDREYTVGVLSLDAVEQIWPLLDAVSQKAKEQGTGDTATMSLPETIDYSCKVLSIALVDAGNPDLTPLLLKKSIPFTDIGPLQQAIQAILADAGLSKGEPVPEEVVAEPSTATSGQSTPSSSPLDAEEHSEK